MTALVLSSRLSGVSPFSGCLAAFAIALFGATFSPAAAADRIQGRVEGGGGPIAQSAVTLWAAGQSAPRKLAETQTDAAGHFDLPVQGAASGEVMYLVARSGEPTVDGHKGPNEAVALMAIIGMDPPPQVVTLAQSALSLVSRLALLAAPAYSRCFLPSLTWSLQLREDIL